MSALFWSNIKTRTAPSVMDKRLDLVLPVSVLDPRSAEAIVAVAADPVTT
ncbi:hypothetical protein ACWGH2_37240 [Streptomyces sp. NPDC054871]